MLIVSGGILTGIAWWYTRAKPRPAVSSGQSLPQNGAAGIGARAKGVMANAVASVASAAAASKEKAARGIEALPMLSTVRVARD